MNVYNIDITPYNENGKAHGYWEMYYFDQLWYKGHYLNGEENGYWEFYDSNGEIKSKEFYL